MKYISRIFFTLTVLILSTNTYSQNKKHFTGMLEYRISIRDTAMGNMMPVNKMVVYTNDTIVRIENYTQNLGKQVAIKHMTKGKSYLLLETDFGNFALQMDADEELSSEPNPNDTATVAEYAFKKKCLKKRLLGRKAKRMLVSHADFEEPIEFLYLKGYSNKIVDTYEEVPGLPVKYSIPMTDAVLDYELVKMSEYTPERDLFGIPDDFERISFNDFMDRLIDSQENME